MSKLTLAAAAIAVFPILDRAGFDASAPEQTAQALSTLTLLYAVCPLDIKTGCDRLADQNPFAG